MRKTQIFAIAAAAAIIAAAPAAMAGTTDYFGNYYYSDGSQERLSRVIAGAAPNMDATYNGGVRCHFRFIVRPEGKQRIQVCE